MQQSARVPSKMTVMSVLQAKLVPDASERHALQAVEDQILRDIPIADQGIAVLPVLFRKDRIGFDCFPQSNVVERFEPRFNILNVLENNHNSIVPQGAFETQFLTEEMSTDGT